MASYKSLWLCIRCFACLILLSITLFNNGHAQKTIHGTVSDLESGKVLQGVFVKFVNTEFWTWTDSTGSYSLTNDNDTTKVIFYLPGYFKNVIDPTEGSILDVALTPMENQEMNLSVGKVKKHELISSIINFEEEKFNKGIISDPMLLIQGKIPGMQIYNRGGNPNTPSFNRIRGITSIQGNLNPLYIIDGIMGASMSNVDPNDIASIQIIKDAATAMYGIRGSNGVVIIDTKESEASGQNIFEYHGQVGISSLTKSIEVMDANEFISNQGLNLGNNTDWMDQIVRNGLSRMHHLSASGGNSLTNYRISGNIRNIEGILKGSGLDQYNVRLKLNSKVLNDRINFGLITSYTDRNRKLGFPEAFRYAVTGNPTSPIYGEDAPFPFNSSQFGGFFQTVGLFNGYNPLAMVTLNQNNTLEKEFLIGINGSYDLTDNLKLHFRTSKQFRSGENSLYYPTTSLLGYAAFPPFRKGFAKIINQNSDFTLHDIFGTYQVLGNKSQLKISGGYSYQNQSFNSYDFAIGGFPSDDIDFINSIESSSDLQKAGFIDASSDAFINDKIISFYGNLYGKIWNVVTLNSMFRREGSSRLGRNNKWGNFYSVGLGLDLTQYVPLSGIELLRFRTNYGTSGNLPVKPGLSQQVFRIINLENGAAFTDNPLWANNRNFKWETKTEFNIGLELMSKRFYGSIDIYQRNMNDLINESFLEFGFGPFIRQWTNEDALKSWGIDIQLGLNILNKKDVNLESVLMFSTSRTSIVAYNSSNGELRGDLGGPGGNQPFVRIYADEPIGNIYGPVFRGVNESGDPAFVDLNKDGDIITNIWALPESIIDAKVLGSGLPDFEIGWNNSLMLGDWKVDAFFRGAFGHSLVNSFRYFYEPRWLIGRSETSLYPYNYVNTELAVDQLAYSRFSSLYVENASFIKLDNFSIAKSISLKEANYIGNLEISIAAQNLFTISSYTGADPEPSLFHTGFRNFGASSDIFPDVLVPGVDRRESYSPSRTVSLGIKLSFD